MSEDIRSIFGYIGRYNPHTIDLEPVLQPFIPDYVPAVGDIDAFIKLPRPDGKASICTRILPVLPALHSLVACLACVWCEFLAPRVAGVCAPSACPPRRSTTWASRCSTSLHSSPASRPPSRSSCATHPRNSTWARSQQLCVRPHTASLTITCQNPCDVVDECADLHGHSCDGSIGRRLR